MALSDFVMSIIFFTDWISAQMASFSYVVPSLLALIVREWVGSLYPHLPLLSVTSILYFSSKIFLNSSSEVARAAIRLMVDLSSPSSVSNFDFLGFRPAFVISLFLASSLLCPSFALRYSRTEIFSLAGHSKSV